MQTWKSRRTAARRRSRTEREAGRSSAGSGRRRRTRSTRSLTRGSPPPSAATAAFSPASTLASTANTSSPAPRVRFQSKRSIKEVLNADILNVVKKKKISLIMIFDWFSFQIELFWFSTRKISLPRNASKYERISTLFVRIDILALRVIIVVELFVCVSMNNF